MSTLVQGKTKNAGRWAIVVTTNASEWKSSDIELTFTRRGLEIAGYYDSFVGLEGGFLTWAEVDEIRAQLL